MDVSLQPPLTQCSQGRITWPPPRLGMVWRSRNDFSGQPSKKSWKATTSGTIRVVIVWTRWYGSFVVAVSCPTGRDA
ncbi:hypothetical protein GUJ93_ZPchr0013g35618 [Zizania palustris]|uniref:Uncharacterized protein n=1 Tax=Zizania palustris TaxID=103762 RepID=A0A8J5WQI6_ZIZPA|nr:hypothetical protein GUJ93_ZPchr0013g35618 [Zizania palustris]